MSATQWTIQFAPHLKEVINRECIRRNWRLENLPLSPGFAHVETDSANPFQEIPFVRRVWRHDFMWPGALGLKDFMTRAGTGLVKRFGHHLHGASEIFVTTDFQDRSHLASRLKELVKKERDAALNPTSRSPTGTQAPLVDLHILMTRKSLVACCMDATEAGLVNSRALSHRTTSETSRASKKVVQALEHAHRLGILPASSPGFKPTANIKSAQSLPPGERPLNGQVWLDLGASPGGITESLYQFGGNIIAVDRAPLHEKLRGIPEIQFMQADVTTLSADQISKKLNSDLLSGIVCDMNGPPEIACTSISRLRSLLRPGGLVIFTLKLAEVQEWFSLIQMTRTLLCSLPTRPVSSDNNLTLKKSLDVSGALHYVGAFHLNQNRNELTLLFCHGSEE